VSGEAARECNGQGGAAAWPHGESVAATERAVAWDLRGAWARRLEVVLVMAADRERLRGYVEHVASTGAFALVWDGSHAVHAPLALVRAVRRPTAFQPGHAQHEPADGEPVGQPRQRAPAIPAPMPGQLSFDFPPEQLELRSA
jgi:hypothetical protein